MKYTVKMQVMGEFEFDIDSEDIDSAYQDALNRGLRTEDIPNITFTDDKILEIEDENGDGESFDD